MKQVIEARLKSSSEWIELEPFGLTAAMDQTRPVMLFREKNGQAVLPVWLAPVDAGIALTQYNSQTLALSPHDLPLKVMDELGIRPEFCEFTELRGHQQYVEVHFGGSRRLRRIRARADHAISFCLQAKVRFFCTRSFLQKCREVQAELKKAWPTARKPTRGPSPYLN